MALFNYATKEITLKIVYYGPGLSGKTTNIQHLHSALNADNKGKLLSLSTESDRTLFFDFLPIELGKIKEFSIRFQLYTVPGQVRYNATRKVVLKGADAVVFVADSQKDMQYQNLESFENMRENLVANNLNPDEIPLIFQYNKRDLKNILSVSELNEDLNPNGACRVIEAEAVNGTGVEEAFQLITRLVLKDISRKHKIEIQPASVKTETKQEERIAETPSMTWRQPVMPASEPADLAFKEALRELSDADLKRSKELNEVFSEPEKQRPEMKLEPIHFQPEEDIMESSDYEADDALSILTDEDSDFSGGVEDIFPYTTPEPEKESSVKLETVQPDSEEDLLEATAYDISAELSGDAVFEIKERLKESFPENETGIEIETELSEPVEAEAIQADPEAELLESTLYDADDTLELDDDSFDFEEALEEHVAEPVALVKHLDDVFESEKEYNRQSLRSITENRNSENLMVSDERFRSISNDILSLNKTIHEMKDAFFSLRDEMKVVQESLSSLNEAVTNSTTGSENLEEIKKEQQEVSNTLRDLTSLINELKTRKTWFRF